MKKYLPIICFLSALSCFGQRIDYGIPDSVYLPEHDPVRIQLINRTGYDMEKLVYENTFFRNLKNRDTTDVFIANNYFPGMIIEAKLQEMDLDNQHYVWHCKGVPYQYEGKSLVVELTLDQSPENKDRFRIKSNLIAVNQ